MGSGMSGPAGLPHVTRLVKVEYIRRNEPAQILLQPMEGLIVWETTSSRMFATHKCVQQQLLVKGMFRTCTIE